MRIKCSQLFSRCFFTLSSRYTAIATPRISSWCMISIYHVLSALDLNQTNLVSAVLEMGSCLKWPLCAGHRHNAPSATPPTDDSARMLKKKILDMYRGCPYFEQSYLRHHQLTKPLQDYHYSISLIAMVCYGGHFNSWNHNSKKKSQVFFVSTSCINQAVSLATLWKGSPFGIFRDFFFSVSKSSPES